MPSPIFLSKPSSGFTLDSIVRGAQLAFVGTYRALQNPELARHGYYQKAVKMAGYSLLFELAFRLVFGVLSLLMRLFRASPGKLHDLYWVLDNVLQVRQLMLFLTKDAQIMDNLFLMSLVHVDHTNLNKHPDTDRLYGRLAEHQPMKTPFKSAKQTPMMIMQKYVRRMRYSLGIWLLSSIPVVGRWVLPVVAFQSFKNIAGGPAALTIFGVGIFCPRWWIMKFLGTYWGTRSMMNDLLAPYFVRLPFSHPAKQLWYENRQGIMFGFGAMFYLSTKIPYVGLFLYGLASASAAYLVTKVSDPIPKTGLNEWTEQQCVWTSENSQGLNGGPNAMRSEKAATSRSATPRASTPKLSTPKPSTPKNMHF